MENRYGYNLEPLHTTFISKIVELTGCELYLELGIMNAENIKDVSKYCKNCVGVDVSCNFDFKGFEFHHTTTDNFFTYFDKKPNIIFIDADHNFEQVKKDFVNSLNILSEHGIIFLHDTDPVEPQLLTLSRCGDSYKIHDWIKINYPELNVMTLPISIAGLTMVNVDDERRVLKFLK